VGGGAASRAVSKGASVGAEEKQKDFPYAISQPSSYIRHTWEPLSENPASCRSHPWLETAQRHAYLGRAGAPSFTRDVGDPHAAVALQEAEHDTQGALLDVY
jgi:hypothetical protein